MGKLYAQQLVFLKFSNMGKVSKIGHQRFGGLCGM
jgi:hypothetical protein